MPSLGWLAPPCCAQLCKQLCSAPHVTAALGWLGPSAGQPGFGPDPVPMSEATGCPPRMHGRTAGSPQGVAPGCDRLGLPQHRCQCRGWTLSRHVAWHRRAPTGARAILLLRCSSLRCCPCPLPGDWGVWLCPGCAGCMGHVALSCWDPGAGAGPAQGNHSGGVFPSPLNGEAEGIHVPEAGAWVATLSPQTSGMTSPALPHQERAAGVEGQLKWVPHARTCH